MMCLKQFVALCRTRFLLGGTSYSQTRYRCTSVQSASAVDLCYISYEELAESGKSAPLIVMHGLMGSRANWQSLSRLMSKKTKKKVLSVDARNHGESPHTEEMDYFLMRDDVLQLMDSQNVERAILVGHSMGGKTFMTTALTRPERVAALVVVDVSPTVSPMARTYPAYLEAMLEISSQLHSLDELPIINDLSLPEARRWAEQKLKTIGISPLIRQFLVSNLTEKDNKFRWRVNVDSIVNNFGSIASFPLFDEERYSGPALFLAGGQSPYVGKREIPRIRELFPAAKIEYVEGAGHWVHSEKPQECLRKICNFLKQINV